MTQRRTELLLVRHGQTPWNAAGRWQGNGDPGLTDLGRSQAQTLARELAASESSRWCRIVSSDLKRARETAEILATALSLDVQEDRRFRELDVGRWTGLVREEIVAREPELLAAFERGEPGVRPGGGESRIDIRVRVRAALRDWATRFPDEPMILVAHLGVVRALVPGQEPENGSATPAIAEEILSRPVDLVRRTSDGPGPL